MDHNKGFKSIVRIILTLCLSLALCMDMGVPYLADNQTTSVLTALFYNIQKSLTARAGSFLTPVFFFLLWANRRIDEKKSERRFLFPLVSAFIAFIWLLAESFRVDNTLWTLHISFGQSVKSVIYFVGAAYGMNQMTCFLYEVLERKGTGNLRRIPTVQKTWRSGIVKAYREHTVLVSFAAVFILWLPHLILAYPANICWDAYDQMAQIFGLRVYSTHHPLASTMIIGGLIKVGTLVSDNFGLFFYITVQAITGAWVLAYTLDLIRELGAPVWLRAVTFGCYIFVPYYTAYIGLILKDVPYSYAVLLFMVELIYLFIRSEDFFRSRRHVLLMAVSIVGTLFFRNNGKHMLYPSIAAVLLYLFFRNLKSKAQSKGRGRVFYSAIAVLLIPVLLAEGISAALAAGLNASAGTIREAFSLPLQQTARYVKECGDEVTEEEKAALSAVLDYEKLAETYNPWISDPVKNLFKTRPTTQELKDYFAVWLKQFTKHPFVYFKATVNQNYYLLYPYIANSSMYINRISDSVGGDVQRDVLNELDFHDAEAIADAKAPLKAFYTMSFYLPGINVLSHPAFYVTLLIWLSLFSFYRKRFVWLLVSVPVWFSVVIVVLAPLVDARYVFPIIYSMPVMLAYFLYLGKEGGN